MLLLEIGIVSQQIALRNFMSQDAISLTVLRDYGYYQRYISS